MVIELPISDYIEFMGNLRELNYWMYQAMLSMSSDGRLSITQQELSDKLNLSRQTINKRISYLKTFYINNQPLLQVSYENDRNLYCMTVVKMSKDLDITSNNNDLKSFKTPVMTTKIDNEKHPCGSPRDVILYFCKKYEEAYGETYLPSWARDTKNVRQKICANYDADTIQATIDTLIRLYPVKWQDKAYPRPTLAGMHSFLFQQALPFANANKREDAAVKKSEFDNVEIKALDEEEFFAQFEKFNN